MEAELDTKVVDRESKTKGDSAKVLDLLAVHRSIGRYELIHRLGHGGMATVYLGRATGKAGFERLVAVKVIHPHLANEPEFVEMFLDEARIAAKIHDPHVVAIHDVGEHDGVFFMVMEYVEGDTLASLVRQLKKDDKKRLPISAILQIAADACEGLVAAHDLVDADDRPLKLVHRDVSPHNLLVGMDGRVKVVDFGIMKAAGKRSNTLTGQLRGKLAYMSPEQAEGKALDHRTDLFALGAVIWELATADRLFNGATESAILMNVLDCQIPDVRSRRPDVTPAMAAMIERALAKDPADRYASARDMLKDLRALLRELPTDVDPRADLSDAAHRYFHGRVEYVRAAVRNRGGGTPLRPARMSDDELFAATENTGEAKPRVSDDEHTQTPALAEGTSVRAARITPLPEAADAEPVAARQTNTNTNTLTASIAGAPARHWSLWLLLPLIGAAIGTAVVRWPRGEAEEPAARTDTNPRATQPADDDAPANAAKKADTVAALPGLSPTIKWYFNTNPPGAIVIVDGKRYDRPTPMDVEMPRGDEPVEVVFEKDGYVTRSVSLAPIANENHTYDLAVLADTVPGTKTKVRHVGPRFETRFHPDKTGTPDAKQPDAKQPAADDRKLEDKPDFRDDGASAGTP